MYEQREIQWPGTATARKNDPDTSYKAADKMNANNGRILNNQQDCVLRALKGNNGVTAKALGIVMAQTDVLRLEWPHKRMSELKLMGFVRRFESEDSKEKTCWITSDGEKYLEKM